MLSLKPALMAALLLAVASPVLAHTTEKKIKYGPNDVECLARVVYHEARGESITGQMAVAEVVVNRVLDEEFPHSICGVVTQRNQFAPIRRAIHEHEAYEVAEDVAEVVLEGKSGDIVKGATYFHTPAVSPSWSRQFERTARIGSHIFYKP